MHERPIAKSLDQNPKSECSLIATRGPSLSVFNPGANEQEPTGEPKERTTFVANWSKEPYGYQWPASRLSRFDMARLTIISNRTKTPLNQLLKEALETYVTSRLKELDVELIQEKP